MPARNARQRTQLHNTCSCMCQYRHPRPTSTVSGEDAGPPGCVLHCNKAPRLSIDHVIAILQNKARSAGSDPPHATSYGRAKVSSSLSGTHLRKQ